MKNMSVWIVGLVLGMMLFSFAGAASTQATQGEYAYLSEITGVSFLPSTVYSGDAVSAAIDIHNKGSTYSITDLNASMSFSGQFEPIQSSTAIGSILPQVTKTAVFKFKVKEDTTPGYYPATITLNYTRTAYDGSNPQQVTETFDTVIPVSSVQKRVQVVLNPKVISPSNQTVLIFSLTNKGNNAVANVSFSWEEANKLILPVGSDNKRYLSSINPGQTVDINYDVAADPNITTGIYPINATLEYSDQNGFNTQVTQVGIIVGGTTDFDVSAENNSGALSISIANIGSNNAGAVIVKLPPQAGVSVSGSNTAILGNLNKGDFTIATFQLQTASGSTVGTGTGQIAESQTQTTTAGGNFRNRSAQTTDANGTEAGSGFASRTLMLQIGYTDTTGARQTVEKMIQLGANFSGTSQTLNTARRTGGVGIISWVLLAIVLIGSAAYNQLRAKKEWKAVAPALAATLILFLIAIFLFNAEIIAIAIALIVSLAAVLWTFNPRIVQKILSRGVKSK